jgi:hypothetical protein
MTPTEKLAVAVRALKTIAANTEHEDHGAPYPGIVLVGLGTFERQQEIARETLATLTAPSPEKAETTGEAVELAMDALQAAEYSLMFVGGMLSGPDRMPMHASEVRNLIDRALRALTERTGGRGEK